MVEISILSVIDRTASKFSKDIENNTLSEKSGHNINDRKCYPATSKYTFITNCMTYSPI